MQLACAVLYCPLRPVDFTYFSTWFHKWHDLQGKKKVTERKMYFLIFSTNFYKISLILRRIQQDPIVNVHKCSWKYPLFLSDSNKPWNVAKIFEKSSNIKCHENPSSGSRVVLRGQTVFQTWSHKSLFETRLKIIRSAHRLHLCVCLRFLRQKQRSFPCTALTQVYRLQ